MLIRIIDVETCGLPPDDNQVVEIATVDLELVGIEWKRGRMWSSLIDPGRPIPAEASAVHHITDETVTGAPKIVDVLSEFVRAPTVPFVYAAHEAKFEKAALPALAGQWICTRKVAATLWPDAPSHKLQVLRYWLNLKFADNPGPPHRAMGDAYAAAALTRRILTATKPPMTVDELLKISYAPVLLSKFNFGKHAMKSLAEVPTDYLEWIVDKSQIEDEDVRYTAQHYLMARRAAHRSRDPLQASGQS